MSKRGGESATERDSCPGMDALSQTRFFKALCDPSRVAILIRLARCCRPQTVTEVACCCPTNISVVSRHLALMRDAGILSCEKRGKEVYYSVRFKELVATLRAMADALDNCCCETSLKQSTPDGGKGKDEHQ